MTPLRILLVEDSLTDAKLLLHALAKSGCEVDHRRVESAHEMRAALTDGSWDVVLSDWSLPSFSALEALGLLKHSGLDLPFIIVSGTIGEETAAEAMRMGAHDYFLKGKLTRLLPAIERELREREGRAEIRSTNRALIASEARYRSIVEQSVDGILTAGPDGMVTAFNRGAERIFGYEAREVIGKPMGMLCNDDPRKGMDQILAPIPEGDRFSRKEAIGRRKDGTPVGIAFTKCHTTDLKGEPEVAVLVHDLSERRRAEATLHRTEEQLRHAQKMEAVGRLAGGVAHDFNNLLSVILSYSIILLEGLRTGDPIKADLEEVRRAAMRASALTKQLLAFSRKQVLNPKLVDLNQIVLGMDTMLGRLLGEDIQLSLLFGEALGTTLVDAGQIEQVLMNLVLNSRDAMPRGGKVCVETANVELDQSYADTHLGVTPGPYVMLAVTDTGAGIDSETLPHIFEPFFTTKAAGQGTGLGLSTVFGIVQQSQGHIWAYSEHGRGTTFKVYLPRTHVGPEALTSESPPPPILHGNETILLVEDEEQLRVLSRSILRRAGYNVLDVANGGEAFLLCEEYASNIHMLLTDVVMPRMSGRQLAARLLPLRPDMKVLYMSGYTESSIIHHGVLDAGVSYLAKPITPDALLRRVREVLDEGD